MVKDDLLLLKPTVFASVPRVFNKFYDAIKEKFKLATGIKA
jgi:long-chain acyl-CoA synthetase